MNRLKSVLAGAAVLTLATVSGSAAGSDRSYVGGHFALELDGVKSGFLKSVEGGAITGEVVEEAAGPDAVAKKHIGNVKYEEISFAVDFNQPKPVLNWISDTLDRKYARKNGAFIAADFNYKEKSRRSFQDALITEVTIPACDASSKDAAYMTVKIKPESIQNSSSAGKTIAAVDAKKQKQWLPSNFRLNIPGVDCTKVQKVDALTIKQSVTESTVGDVRDHLKEPGKIEYPNLRLTVSATHAQDFMSWHEDFVIKGNNEEKAEKTGTLSFLSADLKEELAKITFDHVGIFRVDQPAASAGKENIAVVVIDLYVERMEIDFMAQFEK